MGVVIRSWRLLLCWVGVERVVRVRDGVEEEQRRGVFTPLKGWHVAGSDAFRVDIFSQ